MFNWHSKFLYQCWVLVFIWGGRGISAYSQEADVTHLQNDLSILVNGVDKGRAPGTPGHKSAQDHILDKLISYELSDVKVIKGEARSYVFWRKNKLPEVENIFARIPGKSDHEKRECLVFSAHYDHVHPDRNGHARPGANDNASGVVALLELARMVQEKGWDGQIDLWFLFPDQEENYIAGSPAAVDELLKLCEGKIWANVNLDVVGGKFFDGLENTLLELTGNGGQFWQEFLSDIETPGIEVLANDIYIIEPFGPLIPRSDYSVFRENKVPFVFYTAGTPWYYHTRMDTEDKIDFPFLAKVVNRLYSVTQLFSNEDEYEDLSWSWRTPIDYQGDATRFADSVLTPYLEKAEENKLTGEEIARWHQRINAMKSSKGVFARGALHQSVMSLLSSIEKRSELELNAAPLMPRFQPQYLEKKTKGPRRAKTKKRK